MIVSLSIKIVFDSSNRVNSHKSSFSNMFSSSLNISLRLPPKAEVITSDAIITLNPGVLSLISNPS